MPRWSVPPEVHGDGRFQLRRRDFTPAYLKTYEEGRLIDKVEEALSHLGPSCTVCPRLCKGVDRLANQFGVCKVGRKARVASAFPHFGEEDVLRAIEALEMIGTDDAKAMLKELAKGAAEDRLTEEAKLSLGRLERRSPKKP